MAKHRDAQVAGTPLRTWVRGDSAVSVEHYAARKSRSGWGGEVETAIFALMRGCTVKVFGRAEEGEEGVWTLADGTAIVMNTQHGSDQEGGKVLSVLF